MSDRGVALPMALLVMLVLLVLLAGLASVTKSEPPIAVNHVATAQARALADSGLARARWALGSGVLADPLPDQLPADYTGTVFFPLGARGGFTLAIAAGAVAHERAATATGWVPDRGAPRAVRKVQATLTRLRWLDPPCALCAGAESTGTDGEVSIVGHARIDAATRAAGPARPCPGQAPSAAVMSTGAVATDARSWVNAPPGGDPVVPSVSRDAFAGFTLTDEDLALLKFVARDRGTYYQGARAWADVAPPAGLVFVDTTTGRPLGEATRDVEAAHVAISGDVAWSGWLIVAGSIHVTGNAGISGLLYALDDVVLASGASVVGAVVAANRRGALATTAEAAAITYDCPAARDGGGTVSQRWLVKPGSYRETAGW